MNVEPVHFEVRMALSPIPADINRRELNEAKIVAAAKAAMNGATPLRGPVEAILSMSYPPGSSMRKGHTWRITNPSTWELARFIFPHLKGIVFEGEGQISKLMITKSYGAGAPLTTITVRQLR
jgi:hypothetical protein